MKVMLDTNILVSALVLAPRGVCADVLDVVLAGHHLVVARETLIELEQVLVGKLKVPVQRAREIAAFVSEQATIVQSSEPAAWPLRDADDRWIVGAALEDGVDMLVTGDSDILDEPQTELKTFRAGESLKALRGRTK